MKLFSLKRTIVVIISLFVIYLIIGMLLPFAFPLKISEKYKNEFDIERFYHTDEKSLDKATIIETSKEALDIRIQMINSAKERIIFSTFDIREGESCNDIFAALLNAADDGVEIQILVDGLSALKGMTGKTMFYAVGTHSNVEIKYYNTPNILMPWTIHGRMHDKYIIIDDYLLLLGGRNTFDYFLGEYNTESLSFDREILVYNKNIKKGKVDSAIELVEEYFNNIWNDPACKTKFGKYRGRVSKLDEKRDFLVHHFQKSNTENPHWEELPKDLVENMVSVDKISLVSNPTHIYAKEPYVWYDLYQLMMKAEERVYIFTPYAVFDKQMYEGLTDISKQVEDVKMQLNSTAVGDNFMASSDYTLNRKKILQTGIQVYEFQGTNSSHGKSLLIDDNISVIGSYNFDMRSTYIDTELMLVVEGKEFNKLLEKKITDMEKQSLKVNLDGTYEENPDVPKVEMSFAKKALFQVTSILFQLFRYML